MLAAALLMLVYTPPEANIEWNETIRYGKYAIGSQRRVSKAGSAVLYFDEPHGILVLPAYGSYVLNIGLVSPNVDDFVTEDWHEYDCTEKGIVVLGNNRAVVEFYALNDTDVTFTACYIGTNPKAQFTQVLSGSVATYSQTTLDTNENIAYVITDNRTTPSITLRNIPSLQSLAVDVVGTGRTFRGNTSQEFKPGTVHMITMEYSETFNCDVRLYFIDGSEDFAYPPLTCDNGCDICGLFTKTGSVSTFPPLEGAPPRPQVGPTPAPKKKNTGVIIGIVFGVVGSIAVIVIIVVLSLRCDR